MNDMPMSATTFDIAFIGAGFANLAAAGRLLENGEHRIVLLEQGAAVSRRQCPGIALQKCVFCSRGCAITCGIGGTNALFGNKLCYFPASAEILRFFSSTILEEAWEWLDRRLEGVFDSRHNRPSLPSDSICRKHYHSVVLTPSEFAELVGRLVGPLLRAGVIREGATVERIKQRRDGFSLRLGSGAILQAEQVVLGTGRSNSAFVRKTCRELGISTANNAPDVGVRIEAPEWVFAEPYRYQDDPKIKANFENGSARTFCAENGGIVVPVQFGSSFFAEGAYPELSTGLNNLALMVRTYAGLGAASLEDWCQHINNTLGHQLVVSDISIGSLSADQLSEKLCNALPPLPTPLHDELLRAFIRKLVMPPDGIFYTNLEHDANLRLFAPAIDRYWPVPEVGQNLGTKVPGFHIVGDAAGISRGYVQALTAGAAWASAQIGAIVEGGGSAACLDLV